MKIIDLVNNALYTLTNYWYERKQRKYAKCYVLHQNENGVCYGLVGGDNTTDYLSETCINCPYLEL